MCLNLLKAIKMLFKYRTSAEGIVYGTARQQMVAMPPERMEETGMSAKHGSLVILGTMHQASFCGPQRGDICSSIVHVCTFTAENSEVGRYESRCGSAERTTDALYDDYDQLGKVVSRTAQNNRKKISIAAIPTSI